MRKLLLVAGLLCLALSARAQSPVYEVAKGSAIVNNVLVVQAAVQLDVSSRTFRDAQNNPTGFRFAIEIYNDDSANNLFCGFSPAVSATATANSYGRRVAARSSWTVAVPRAVKVYCISDSAAGVRAVFTQLW